MPRWHESTTALLKCVCGKLQFKQRDLILQYDLIILLNCMFVEHYLGDYIPLDNRMCLNASWLFESGWSEINFAGAWSTTKHQEETQQSREIRWTSHDVMMTSTFIEVRYVHVHAWVYFLYGASLSFVCVVSSSVKWGKYVEILNALIAFVSKFFRD